MAGAIAPSFAAEGEPKKRALRKGIMYSTIGVPGSVMEKFRAVKEAGFEGVEAMGGMSNDEVMEAAKANDLKIPSVCCHTHWARPLSDANPEARKVGVQGLETSLRDAKKYGAKSVLLVPAMPHPS